MRSKGIGVLKCGLIVLTAVFSLGIVAGCGDSKPRRIAVRGNVTYRGKPLGKGTVSFTRIGAGGASLNRPATGELQSDGSYAMRTFGQDDGVLPGEYAVTIVSLDYGKRVAADRGATVHGQEPPARLPSLIPEKYGSPQMSGLKASVPPDASGTLRFDFDLAD